MRALILLLLGLGAAISTVKADSDSTCYWPNGKETGDKYSQCPGSKNCCVNGEACLSNGLCFRPKDMTLYRGGCSDSSWPSECTGACFNMQTRYANMWRCDESQKYNFTCGILGEPSTCGDPKDYYIWDESDLTNITTPQLGLSVLASESNNTSTSSSNKNALGIGLGVGLGVPLVFAGAALVWLYCRIRNLQDRFKLLQEQQRSGTPTSNLKFQAMTELDTGGVSGSSELQSNPRSELPS